MMKKYILFGILLIIIFSGCEQKAITNLEECIAAGNPAMESYPRQCRANEQTFVEVIETTNLKADCEEKEGTWIESPKECEYINEADCLNLEGTFNECSSACRNDPNAEICTMQCVPVCSFEPIIGGDKDEHGCIGSAGYTWCESKGRCLREWEEGCPTEIVDCATDEHCIIGGCSGTVCQPKGKDIIFTTCEYKEEYACYKQISCNCIDNKCIWDETDDFDKCLEEARTNN